MISGGEGRRDYFVRRGVGIPLRDRVRLSADIYIPASEGPFPVLLTRTPYGKENVFQTQFILNMQFADAVAEGFVVIAQDTRGRGGSDGEFTPFETERSDAEDTLDWIVDQPFSDGRVAMFGASYVGATQWLAAESGHPALTSVAPVLTSPDFLSDWIWTGGAFQLAFQLQWAYEALCPIDIERRQWRSQRSYEQALHLLRCVRKAPDQSIEKLPLMDEGLIDLAPHLGRWMRLLEESAEVEHAFAPPRVSGTLAVPGLHVIGWNDIFASGGLKAYARAVAAGAPAANSQYLVAGPWSHGNMSDWQGDFWYGYDSSAEGIGLQNMQLEFARAILEDREPALPRVLYFTSGVDEWRTADAWPLPDTVVVSCSLSADRTLQADGQLLTGGVEFESHPLDPVPSLGGPSFLPGLLQGRNSAQKDQRLIEERRDVAVFTSPPLEADLHLAGAASLILRGSCDREDCDWVVRLCDVSETGRSISIADGILRARSRDETLRPLEPNIAEQFVVEMSPTSHVFKAGHALRIQIAGTNFPRFDRNPHQMVPTPTARKQDMLSARQTVWCGGEYGTQLLLPVANRP